MLSFILNTDDPEQDGLLDSFFSSGKAISQELVRNDKVLAFQIVPVVPSVGETQLWDSDHLSTDTYLVAVGNEDDPPTGGTWPLTLGANTVSAIAYNVTASALQSALMAAGFGTLTVLLLQAGVYQVTWTANGAIAQMTSAANTLSPDSGVTINVVAAGSASTQAVQVVTLRQSVVAAAAPATQLPAAAIAATVTRAGSGTVNKIYALTMTAGTYGGTFSLTVTAATGSAQGLGVVDANISAEDFAALLATQTVIASTDNVSVQRVGTVLNVEFVGTQGLSDVPVIAVTNIDLLAPKGVSGTINFNTIPLNRAFWNTTETELTYRFAVRRARATGEEREFYNASVTLKRNLIDASTMVAVFTGGITIGATGIIGGTSGRVLYNNAGVVGEISGATSNGTALTLVAPVLGAATAASINGITISAGSGTLTLGNGSILISTAATINTGGGSGYINTSADLGGFTGGHINTQGGTSANGGYIRTHAGALGTGVGDAGGNIDTSNGGGSIRTDYGGGSIDTRSVGQIEMGILGTRTTVVGSATTARVITLPDATGTVALTSYITGGTLAGSFTTLAGTSSATLGTNGGTGGSVVLRGSTSGSATINVSATGGLQLGTPTSLVLTNATGILRGLAAQETVASYNGVTLTGTMYFADATARANGTLTGIGTLFTTEAKVGDRIATASDGTFGSQAGPFFVKSIASNTSLTLTNSGNAAQIGSGNAVSAKIFRSILTAQSAAGLNLVTISADGTFILGTPPTSLPSGAFAAATANATFNHVYLAGNRLYSSGGWRSIETYGGSANVDIGLSESGTTRVHILSVASTLAVTGATTLTGLLTANGGITVVGGTYLLTTNTILTDHTGTNTATIGFSSNAPNSVMGEPSKWIAIDDNGTTRYIPTWG